MAADLSKDTILKRYDALRDEIVSLTTNDEQYRNKIYQLEQDLLYTKRFYNETLIEKNCLQTKYDQLKSEFDKQKEDFEKQVQVSRVMVLLDGDGAIFDPKLIAQGQSGGHQAAEQLTDSVKSYLFSIGDACQYQLWVYIFLNKRGLTDALNRCGYSGASAGLKDFMDGFNQAAERFIMADVGSGKEAADAKIKAILEDEIRLPQTYKILFGGCHDNGYVTTIRSHITCGFKQKLVLLRSYAEHASGFDDLALPMHTIPGLFMSQKLGPTSFSSAREVVKMTLPTTMDSPTSGQSSPTGSEKAQNGIQPASDDSFRRPALPASYSSAVLKRVEQRHSAQSPELNSDSTANEDSESCHSHASGPPFVGTRRLNSKLPLSKQKPPPCTLFYLTSNCKHGSDCRYGHDYILNSDHYDEMRASAKRSPCPAINRGDICTWGDACCYGHVCPLTTKCLYLKVGRCKFVGADMHKEPKTAKNYNN